MFHKYFSTGLRWLWITFIVLGLDRLTKVFAQKYLIFQEPVHVMPSFNLMLSYNRGSAFSFLDQASGWQSYFFGGIAILVSAIILVLLKRMSASQKWVGVALTLVLGGALGNLWDRLSYGHVVDFIQWYAGNFYWPTFNIADSAVCVGAVMLVIDAVRKK